MKRDWLMSCVCLRQIICLELLVLCWEVISEKYDHPTSSERWLWLFSCHKLASTYPGCQGNREILWPSRQPCPIAEETRGPFLLMHCLFLINSIKHCFRWTARTLLGSLVKTTLPPRPHAPPCVSSLRHLLTVPGPAERDRMPLKYVFGSIHITRVLSPRLTSQKTWPGTYHRLLP